MDGAKMQRLLFGAFAIIVLAALFTYPVISEKLNLADLQNYLGRFGLWAPTIFIIVYVIGTIFIPSTPFMAAAGLLFGFKYGLIYTVIAGFLSSLLVFAFSRKLGKSWVDSLLRKRYAKYLNRYNSYLHQDGMVPLIILRLTPIMPFNVLNILMGVSKIRTRDYILGTLLGLIPSNIAAVYFGNLLTKIF